MADRLNRAFVLLQQQIQILSAQIAAIKPAAAAAAAPTSNAPIKGDDVRAGSDAMIQPLIPGGTIPNIPPFITAHTMLVGEGSAPIKLLTFTNGQLPIGSTGADPVAAGITADSTSFTTSLGIAVKVGPGSIAISLNDSMQTWIAAVSAFTGVTPPT